MVKSVTVGSDTASRPPDESVHPSGAATLENQGLAVPSPISLPFAK
jgi:hypothetical protein